LYQELLEEVDLEDVQMQDVLLVETTRLSLMEDVLDLFAPNVKSFLFLDNADHVLTTTLDN
jgi:hypothetical protein